MPPYSQSLFGLAAIYSIGLRCLFLTPQQQPGSYGGDDDDEMLVSLVEEPGGGGVDEPSNTKKAKILRIVTCFLKGKLACSPMEDVGLTVLCSAS